VIGDADRGLTVGRDCRYDLTDTRCTVEHRVLGVQMQVDERVAQVSAPEERYPQALWVSPLVLWIVTPL
jgi:hypothetical protein